MRNEIRQAAVAGLFYPKDPQELSLTIEQYLDAARVHPNYIPKAIIAPHAGYIYSGPIAGNAYKGIERARNTITRVILLGPSHRVAFRGVATSSADYFVTPLGKVPIDTQAVNQLVNDSLVEVLDSAHENEHSLEVQLPFLQETLYDFSIVPLVIGDATPAEVGKLLEQLWGGPETLIVISSDLSHYQEYDVCQSLDERTSEAIEHLEPESIGCDQACGRIAINGLLTIAKQQGLQVERMDVRNSGDTAGPRDRVVGYGAYWFH